MNIQRVVFTTGTVWAQEGQTTETMLKREDGGYDIVYEFTSRPGKRQLLLFPEDARAFDHRLEAGGFLSWASDIYQAPEPQGVRWALLIEGEGFEELALQGASKAFPAGFPEFVKLMDWAFRVAVAHSSQAATQKGRTPLCYSRQ